MSRRYLVNNIALVMSAISASQKYHKGQTRKVSGDPYYHHTIAVALIVVAFKRSKHLGELICAAILHDTLEDTKLTFEQISQMFSPFVASLVFELTNDEEEIKRIGKLAYHKKKLLGISNYALVIKLADRLHNISDNPTQKMITETLELMTHLKRNRKLTKTQKAIVAEIESLCKAKES